MKHTQIDWCPTIPDNWRECRIKDIARLQSGNGISANDIDTHGEYPVYGGNGLRGYTNIYTNVGNYVLIGRQGALCGNINYAKGKFYATEHAVVCYPYNPNEVTKWFGETLRCADLNRLSATAAQPGLSVSGINNQFIPYPPDNERRLIADYLDTKTAAIDKRIAVLEKKQEVYSRLRRSIINRAVTRGLTPNVPLKDSGVDWIGMIPEHWEVRRMKDITCIVMGQSPDGKEIEEYGEIPFMQGKAEFGNRHPNAKFYCDTCTKQSSIDDILMSVRAPIGDTNISDRVYGIGRGLCAIHPENCDVYYLWYLLNKAKPHIESLGTGSTFLAISTSIISDMDVVFPPLPEQRAIASYLDEKCAKIDAAVANIGKQIDALKRLKRALINEVVTGKRKV